jgi:hypothetical protein
MMQAPDEMRAVVPALGEMRWVRCFCPLLVPRDTTLGIASVPFVVRTST